MDRWVGKVALVTGASAGIGAATVTELVKCGMQVIGVARREERVQELQNKVGGAKGKLYARKCDVSREADILELFSWIKEKFGTIHVLVNNAGIVRYGKLYDQNPKYWKDVLDTNVMGLSLCTQEALKLMKNSGVDDGQIIHLNSTMGHGVPKMATPMTGMYAASKNAVTALTETLRQELVYLGSKIRISSISPGVVRTEIGDAANAAMEENERIDRSNLTGKEGADRPMLESEDVAQAVVYILSTPPRVQIHELTIKPVGETM